MNNVSYVGSLQRHEVTIHVEVLTLIFQRQKKCYNYAYVYIYTCTYIIIYMYYVVQSLVNFKQVPQIIQ